LPEALACFSAFLRVPQWALPDPNCDRQSSAGTAGP
jgi:hypothetical protein